MVMHKDFKCFSGIIDWCQKLSDKVKIAEAMRKMIEEQNRKMRGAILRSK